LLLPVITSSRLSPTLQSSPKWNLYLINPQAQILLYLSKNAWLGDEWWKVIFNQCTLSHFMDYGNTPLDPNVFNTRT